MKTRSTTDSIVDILGGLSILASVPHRAYTLLADTSLAQNKSFEILEKIGTNNTYGKVLKYGLAPVGLGLSVYNATSAYERITSGDQLDHTADYLTLGSSVFGSLSTLAVMTGVGASAAGALGVISLGFDLAGIGYMVLSDGGEDHYGEAALQLGLTLAFGFDFKHPHLLTKAEIPQHVIDMPVSKFHEEGLGKIGGQVIQFPGSAFKPDELTLPVIDGPNGIERAKLLAHSHRDDLIASEHDWHNVLQSGKQYIKINTGKGYEYAELSVSFNPRTNAYTPQYRATTWEPEIRNRSLASFKAGEARYLRGEPAKMAAAGNAPNVSFEARNFYQETLAKLCLSLKERPGASITLTDNGANLLLIEHGGPQGQYRVTNLSGEAFKAHYHSHLGNKVDNGGRSKVEVIVPQGTIEQVDGALTIHRENNNTCTIFLPQEASDIYPNFKEMPIIASSNRAKPVDRGRPVTPTTGNGTGHRGEPLRRPPPKAIFLPDDPAEAATFIHKKGPKTVFVPVRPERPKPNIPVEYFDDVFNLRPSETRTLGRADIKPIRNHIPLPGAKPEVSRRCIEIGRLPASSKAPDHKSGAFTLKNIHSRSGDDVIIERGLEKIRCIKDETVDLKFGDIIILPDETPAGTRFRFNVPRIGEAVYLRNEVGGLDRHVVVSASEGNIGVADIALSSDFFEPEWLFQQTTQQGDVTRRIGIKPNPSATLTDPPARRQRAPVPAPSKPNPLQVSAAVLAGMSVGTLGLIGIVTTYLIVSEKETESIDLTDRLHESDQVYIVNDNKDVESGWEVVSINSATNLVTVGKLNPDTRKYNTRNLAAVNVASVDEMENGIINPKSGLSNSLIEYQKNRNSELASCSLSSDQFNELFGNDRLKQTNVGDCYLLVAFDALDETSDFELIMRKSIKISTNADGKNIYSVNFPLGEIRPTQKIEITDDDLAPQTNPEEGNKDGDTGEIDTREYLTAVNAAKGYQILEAAYIKYVTGGNNSRIEIEGGLTGPALSKMFGGHAQDISSTPAPNNASIHSSEAAEKSVKNILLDFQKNRDVLSASSLISPDKKTKTYATKNTTLYYRHAYTISDVELSGDKTQVVAVELVNPWDTSEKFTLPFDVFTKNFRSISGARLQ